ncbi:MAG: hypothetical protein AAF585_04005 [Verrucomicrobiota bacterium]
MSSFYLGKKELLRLAKAVFTQENFVIVESSDRRAAVDFFVHPVEDASEQTPILCYSSSLPISGSELNTAVTPAIEAGLTGIQLLTDGEFTPEALDRAEEHGIDLTGGKEFQAAMASLPEQVKKKPFNSGMSEAPAVPEPLSAPELIGPEPAGDVSPPPMRRASTDTEPHEQNVLAPAAVAPMKPVHFDDKESWKRTSYGAKTAEEIKTGRSSSNQEITADVEPPASPFAQPIAREAPPNLSTSPPAAPPSPSPEFFQPIEPESPTSAEPPTPAEPPTLPEAPTLPETPTLTGTPKLTPQPLPPIEPKPDPPEAASIQHRAAAHPNASSLPKSKRNKNKRRFPVVGLLTVLGGIAAAVYLIGPDQIPGKIQELISKYEPQSNTASSPKGSVAVIPPPPAKPSNSGQPNTDEATADFAKQVIQTSQAAKAAGHNFLIHGDNLDATVADIARGVTIRNPGSPFDGNYFGLPGLTKEQLSEAKENLIIVDSVLTLRSDIAMDTTQLVSPPIPEPSTAPKLANSFDATPKRAPLPAPPAPVTTQQPLMPVGGGQSMRSLAPLRFNVSSLRGDQKYGDSITAWLRDLWEMDAVKEPNLKESLEFCLAIWTDSPQLPMTAIEFDNRRSKAEISPRLIHALLPLIGENDEITLLKHAFESDWDLDNPDADPVIRYHMRCRLAMLTETSEDRDAALEALNGLLDSRILEKKPDEVAHEILFNQELALPFIAKNSLRIWRSFSANPNQPPAWLVSIMKGHFHVAEARSIRGATSTDMISDEELKLVNGYLGLAGDEFQKAWMQNPNHPDAAAQMILISSTLRGTPTHEMRRWFDRSIAVQADYQVAFAYMFDGLGPNWHGSERMVIEFGRTCLKTKRYDLGTPLQLLNAHVKLANLRGDTREYFQQLVAEDFADLELMFDEAIADPSRAEWRAYDRSLAALTWWCCGRRDRSLEFLNEVKYRVDLRAFQQLGVDPVIFWQDFAQNQGAKVTAEVR